MENSGGFADRKSIKSNQCQQLFIVTGQLQETAIQCFVLNLVDAALTYLVISSVGVLLFTVL